jgi:hypothetical protein
MSQTFTTLDSTKDIVSNPGQIVTSPLWANNVGTLATYYTSSLLTNTQKQYYYNVVSDTSPSASGQFAVTYGNRLGSGSYSGGGQLNDSPTRAIYSQYRNILLTSTDSQFTFYGGVNSDNIYVITVDRARLKERLNAGTWQLNLAQLNGAAYSNAVYTGSNVAVSSSNPKIISLIDDSLNTASPGLSNGGRVYNVVSGSINSGIFGSTISAGYTYGLVYPDLGLIVLNGDMLNSNLSFNTVTASYTVTGSSPVPGGDNAWKLYTSISGAAAVNAVNGFTARSQESIKSQIVFVRPQWSEYNYSNNPSFVTSSNGQTIIAQPFMRDNPQVYITSVGLYDSNYNLVAVAKLSKPLQKSFDRELLIKVKIDF